jgi:uncharacterized RDD family membrane protein YckC
MGIGGDMTQQQTLPPRTGAGFGEQPPAYNAVSQPRLFYHVMRRRILAFIVDAIIILLLTATACVVVLVLGVLTLGLGWLLIPIVFPVVGLGYNAVTIGGRNAATVGQRMMGLEVRMWHGGRVTPVIAAFHALLFWLSYYSMVLWLPNFGWAFFDESKRCVHDILAGVVVTNRP